MIIAYGLTWHETPDGDTQPPGSELVLCDSHSARWQAPTGNVRARWLVAPREFAEAWTLDEVHDDQHRQLLSGPIAPGCWPTYEQARASGMLSANVPDVRHEEIEGVPIGALAYVLPLASDRPIFRGITIRASNRTDRDLPSSSFRLVLIVEDDRPTHIVEDDRPTREERVNLARILDEFENIDDVREIIPLVERLRKQGLAERLPVLPRCSDCGWYDFPIEGAALYPVCLHPRTTITERIDEKAPPPSACPLRGRP